MAKNLYTIYDSSHDAHVLFDAPTVITCICSYGNLIFIGTVDGWVKLINLHLIYSFNFIIQLERQVIHVFLHNHGRKIWVHF